MQFHPIDNYLENYHSSYHSQLSGGQAFYNQPGYKENLFDELTATVAPAPVYTIEDEPVPSLGMAALGFTLPFINAIYHGAHYLLGRVALLPATNIATTALNRSIVDCRERIENADWKYKRISIQVDGDPIDCVIAVKPDRANTGRWAFLTVGNGQVYQDDIDPWSYSFRIADRIQANIIMFNYPGVGASTGSPSRETMTRACHAVLSFIEDQEKGLAANEIIGIGHSIGAAVQGDLLLDRELKPDINYLFIKSRTFSSLSSLVPSMFTYDLSNWYPRVPVTAFRWLTKPVGPLLKILGWNFNAVESSKRLAAPEIILQTVERQKDAYGSPIFDQPPEFLNSSEKLTHDGLITAEASLAKAILDDPTCPEHNKRVIGITEKHNSYLQDATIKLIATTAEELLAAGRTSN